MLIKLKWGQYITNLLTMEEHAKCTMKEKMHLLRQRNWDYKKHSKLLVTFINSCNEDELIKYWFMKEFTAPEIIELEYDYYLNE